MTTRSTPRKPQPVTSIQVIPAAWATAKQLADGDYQRLRIIDGRTILVLNRPGQFRRAR